MEGTTSRRRARQKAWLAAQITTLLFLRQKFPQAFARLNVSVRRPLKVGIHADIAAALPDLTRIEISRALQFYCHDVRYHGACIEGAERIDLDGKVAGTVSAAHAESAKRGIADIESKLKRRQERRTKPAPVPAAPAPKRLSLGDLRAAAAARKLLVQGA
jgi:ProP effector